MFKFLRDWFGLGSESETKPEPETKPSGCFYAPYIPLYSGLAEHKSFILESVNALVGPWYAYEVGLERLKSAREVCKLLGEDVSGFDSQIEFIEQTQHLIGWDLGLAQEHPDFSSWDQEEQERRIQGSDQEFLNNVYSTSWRDTESFYKDFSSLSKDHPKNTWRRQVRLAFGGFLGSNFWREIKKKI